mmetsp:Transcript_22237/g.63224  ORF Transcript_22237/g.63224 Transcript_22237/m.63224 type:complete len:202 (-) Transcript_22237:2335-2940(-)
MRPRPRKTVGKLATWPPRPRLCRRWRRMPRSRSAPLGSMFTTAISSTRWRRHTGCRRPMPCCFSRGASPSILLLASAPSPFPSLCLASSATTGTLLPPLEQRLSSARKMAVGPLQGTPRRLSRLCLHLLVLLAAQLVSSPSTSTCSSSWHSSCTCSPTTPAPPASTASSHSQPLCTCTKWATLSPSLERVRHSASFGCGCV